MEAGSIRGLELPTCFRCKLEQKHLSHSAPMAGQDGMPLDGSEESQLPQLENYAYQVSLPEVLGHTVLNGLTAQMV